VRVLIVVLIAFASRSFAATTFKVSFPTTTRSDLASGRLIVYLLGPNSKTKADPANILLWSAAQPLYGVDAKNLPPGAAIIVDESAASFPVKLSQLKPGSYRAQAVLRIHREHSGWRRDPGNLYSDAITFEIQPNADQAQTLSLNHIVEPRKHAEEKGVEIFETRSKLLSDFRGKDISLRAGVVFPIVYNPGRSYPAVYSIPGFSGDHFGAYANQESRTKLDKNSYLYNLYENAFWIVPDPESPNGHTLMANSQVNGPVGDAFVRELIPALEERYHLISNSSARLLKGHSSGGWSVLWLALNYPETFDNCWCISPDPVDFQRLERVDIYHQDNLYFDRDSRAGHIMLTRSERSAENPYPTARTENLIEEVLGPDNTSGEQWDSWSAVFGPRNSSGHPAALIDPSTGVIDHAVADQYKSHDIAELLRNDPERYAPIFHGNVRLLVGERDTFFLNEAVELLKQTLDNYPNRTPAKDRRGYIKIAAGADHGSVLKSPEGMAMPGEMLDHVRLHHHIPDTQPSTRPD